MDFKILDLGLIDYKSAWELQKKIFQQVKNGRLNAALLICSHYPVITLGRRANKKNILIAKEKLHSEGINIYEVERGGEVTYHGPGQLTAYPVFNLEFLKKDVHWFLRQLESITIECLLDFSINAHTRHGLTGVWVDKFKIASIGIAIKNWITFHGLSINIRKNDLINFNFIRPCGMDITMAALETFYAKTIDIRSVKWNLIRGFEEFFAANRSVLSEEEEVLCRK